MEIAAQEDILTEEEKNNPVAALEKLRAEKEKLLDLEAQIKRDGENLYAQAKERCKEELAEIARREVAIAPREEKLKIREGEVSSREMNVGARETVVSQREAVVRERSAQVDARDRAVSAEKVALAEDMARHRAKVIADEARLKGERMIFEQRQATADATRRAETESALNREAKIQKDEAEVAEKKAKAGAIVAELESIKEKLATELGRRALDLEARERAVQEDSAKANAAKKAAEEKLEEARRIQGGFDRQRAEQDQTARGLEKAKIDVEIAQAKVAKREVLVNSLIEKHNLAEEMEKLEEPASPDVPGSGPDGEGG